MLAFCLYKFFAYGGLQRDFLRIARECSERGYKIRVYTLSWAGEIPADFDVIVVPVNAITNHTRYQKYRDWVHAHLLQSPVNGVIGFNKMPGLDVYYAADSCYEDKAQNQRGSIYRLIPRYKHFSRFERAVFDSSAHTRILMLTEAQASVFLKHYDTQQDRIHVLPPGISRDRIAPENAREIGSDLRMEFGVADDEYLLLMVGSGFITKGLDRIIRGMIALPEELRRQTRLIAIGQDNPRTFRRMAQRLGLGEQVTILSGRDDIPRFLMAADLLVHPAINENAGMILLEAIVAGLPVLATDVCGYASYVEDSGAGQLIPTPWRQEVFDKMLAEMLTSPHRQEWSSNGIRFAAYADIYSMPKRAADLICEVVE
ncbi:MAG: glycosyltransferase family 4 protein [Pseudomonadales bacterium]